MSRKKLLVFLPRLDGGGAEAVMLGLITEMVQQDLPVELLVIQNKGELVEQVHAQIKVTQLGFSRGPFIISTLWAFYKIIRKANSISPTNMIASVTGMNLFLLMASLFFKESHQVIVREAVTLKNYRSRLKKYLVKKVYPLAKFIICVSEDVREDMIGLLGNENKLVVINNPVNVSEIREKSKESFSHIWLENKNLNVLACMGRLNYQKGFDIVIKAFSKLNNNENLRLLILGEGGEKQNLLELAGRLELTDKIEFLGFQANPFKIISKTQVFILASRWEGFVNSLLQVVSLGVPVVSTDCRGGPKEILLNGKYGTLVPVDDVDSMADAIENKLNLVEIVDIPEEYFEQYTVKNILAQYLKLYD